MSVKCPFCGKVQTGRPIKRWKYGDPAVDASRYRCTCGKNFDLYDGHGSTWTVPKPNPKTRSTGMCKGICKKFEVKKPTGIGRYESGQGRCQTCEIWIDHRGVYTRGNLPATEKSTGWFCNCCNYRVRRKPRNRKYKEALKAKTEQIAGEAGRIKPEIPSQEKILLGDYKSTSTSQNMKNLPVTLPL